MDNEIVEPDNKNAGTADEIWAFDEPSPYGGNAHITMTKAEIIKHQMDREDVKYTDEEKAFEDFITINWCYKEAWVRDKVAGLVAITALEQKHREEMIKLIDEVRQITNDANLFLDYSNYSYVFDAIGIIESKVKK